jgi:hypothetical protein
VAKRKSEDGVPIEVVENGKFRDAPTLEEKKDKRWWLMKGDKQAETISATVTSMFKLQSTRLASLTTSARLYGNLGSATGVGVGFGRMAAVRPAPADRVVFNVIQAVVDTVQAKMTKNKPRPLFLTSGGNYKQMRRAKRLQKFVDGIFYENKAYRLGSTIFRDSGVFGSGFIHVYEDNNRVCFERVLAGELFCDEVEALYGEPRQIHYVKNIDRQVVIDCYAKGNEDLTKKLATYTAPPVDPVSMGATESDLIQVKESWHLRSGPKAKDGRHVISCGQYVLFEEKWDKDYFPFSGLHWNKRLFGFWGQGIAEQLMSIQLEINRLLWVIQQSLYMNGTYKILVKNGSKIVKEHLNNLIGAIIQYEGDVPPSYVLPPGVQPEMYEQLERLVQKAFQLVGVSELSASGTKPAGLDSGRALREFNDINSDRFNTIGQAYEEFFLDLAKMAVDLARDIALREGEYPVKVPGRSFVLDLDWEDVDLENDAFVMQIFPVSSLPTDPAGRLQTVTEMTQAGWLTPRQARRLMNFPDLETAENQFNAAEDYLEMVLDKIVDDGKFTAPDEFDDLAGGRELALAYYQQGKCHKLAPGRLEMLRRFMQAIDEMTQMAQETAAAAQNAQPGAPGQIASPVGAVPQPPSASPLLPQQGAGAPQ